LAFSLCLAVCQLALAIEELILIAGCSSEDEYLNRYLFLPLR
jgi:hypothetical protein